MFTLGHIIWLAVIFSLVAVSLFVSVRHHLSSKTAAKIFLVIGAISEVVKDMVNMIPAPSGEGFVLDPYDIPLMFCSLIVLLMIVVVFGRDRERREHLNCFIVVTGLVAPLLALLIPTEGTDLKNPQTYQYFLYHGAYWWYSLYHVISGQADLGFKSYLRNLLYVVILVFIVLYCNSALSIYNVNYCFLVKPPVEGLPILNLDHGWVRYFFSMLFLILTAVTLIHLPHMIKERKRDKTTSECDTGKSH